MSSSGCKRETATNTLYRKTWTTRKHHKKINKMQRDPPLRVVWSLNQFSYSFHLPHLYAPGFGAAAQPEPPRPQTVVRLYWLLLADPNRDLPTYAWSLHTGDAILHTFQVTLRDSYAFLPGPESPLVQLPEPNSCNSCYDVFQLNILYVSCAWI